MEPLVAEFLKLDKILPFNLGTTINKKRTKIIKELNKRVSVTNKVTKDNNISVLAELYKDKAQLYFQQEYDQVLKLSIEVEHLYLGQESYLFDILKGRAPILKLNQLFDEEVLSLSHSLDTPDEDHNKRVVALRQFLVDTTEQYKIIRPVAEPFITTDWEKMIKINTKVATMALDKASRLSTSISLFLKRGDLSVPIRNVLLYQLETIGNLQQKQAEIHAAKNRE